MDHFTRADGAENRQGGEYWAPGDEQSMRVAGIETDVRAEARLPGTRARIAFRPSRVTTLDAKAAAVARMASADPTKVRGDPPLSLPAKTPLSLSLSSKKIVSSQRPLSLSL